MEGSHDTLPILKVTSSRSAREWVKKVRREMDIRIAFQLKKKGFSNAAIAQIMDISESTVNAFNKVASIRLKQERDWSERKLDGE